MAVISKTPSLLLRDVARELAIEHRQKILSISTALIVGGAAMIRLGQKMVRGL